MKVSSYTPSGIPALEDDATCIGNRLKYPPWETSSQTCPAVYVPGDSKS